MWDRLSVSVKWCLSGPQFPNYKIKLLNWIIQSHFGGAGEPTSPQLPHLFFYPQLYIVSQGAIYPSSFHQLSNWWLLLTYPDNTFYTKKDRPIQLGKQVQSYLAENSRSQVPEHVCVSSQSCGLHTLQKGIQSEKLKKQKPSAETLLPRWKNKTRYG